MNEGINIGIAEKAQTMISEMRKSHDVAFKLPIMYTLYVSNVRACKRLPHVFPRCEIEASPKYRLALFRGWFKNVAKEI